MPLAAYMLAEAPDLTLAKYQSLANSGVEGLLERHSAFLRQWHGICLELDLSVHLLYLFDPHAHAGTQLKLFFLVRGEASSLELAHPLIDQSPLSEFFKLNPCDIPDCSFNAGATLAKSERTDGVLNPLSDSTYRINYVPEWEMNDSCRLVETLKMLQVVASAYQGKGAASRPRPCAYRVDLYPTQDSDIFRSAFMPVIKTLKGDFDIRVTDDQAAKRRDDHALDVCHILEGWLDAIETSPHFRMNVYAFADQTFQAKFILNAAYSEAVRSGNCLVAPISQDSDGMLNPVSRLDAQPKTYCVYNDDKHTVAPSWPTTFTLEEVAPFFRFPALYDGESFCIRRETAPPINATGIDFGADENGYKVLFPTHMMTRHAFFTGMPGSGKTNTMLHLATELHRRGIPFLALEPAKKEYRKLLLMPEMSDVLLFSPHIQSSFPLQVNPFQFPAGVQLSEHVNALLAVFQGSFVLEGPTYIFLSRAIQRTYKDLGWSLEDRCGNSNPKGFPTLRDVYERIEAEIDASSYDSEIKGNVRSFLQVRLGSLMERDAGDIFNARISTLNPEEWLQATAIVELEVLDSQTQSFLILLLCQYVLESLRSNPNASPNADIRHALFIEEAHNLIASDSQQASADTVDPKVSATEYIVKMLAEVRALREALIIADQLPTTLAPEVVKNTGLKIVHRLAAREDRQIMGSAISASAVQLERMNRLSTGEAYMYYEGVERPFIAKLPYWEAPESDVDYTSDDDLARFRGENIAWPLYAFLLNWCDSMFTTLDEEMHELDALFCESAGQRNAGSFVLKKTALIEKLSEARLWIDGRRIQWSFAADCLDGALGRTLDEAEAQLALLRQHIEDMSSLVSS